MDNAVEVLWGLCRWTDGLRSDEETRALDAACRALRRLEGEEERPGVFKKYSVVRLADRAGKHVGCDFFVLDVTHDPHAVSALLAYAESVANDNPDLAKELRARLGLVTHE